MVFLKHCLKNQVMGQSSYKQTIKQLGAAKVKRNKKLI
jgi:hypothetical protein